MQSQPPSPYPPDPYLGSRQNSSNGTITTGFVISLIAFILIFLMLIAYSFIVSPVGISHFRSLKNFYNNYIYIQAFFGLIGAVGFVISLAGTIPAVNKTARFPHFQAAYGLAFGFVGMLVLIEFVIRILQFLLR